MKRLVFFFIIIFILQVYNSYAVYFKLGDYQSGGRVVSLDIDGNYLYSAKYDGFIEIINISDPEHPQLTGCIQVQDYIPGVVGRIIISDTLAFILGHTKIHIVSITDPTIPLYVGNLDFGNASDIIITENIAYIAGKNSFYILDITNIQLPQLLGSVNSELDGICLNDTLIYGVHSGGPNNLHIINIAVPQNPIIVSNNLNLGIGSHADIGFYNFHVFIVNSSYLRSIDVNNSTNPIIIDTMMVENHSYNIFIQNNKAIINNSVSGIKVIDISDPAHLSSLGYYDAPGSSSQVVALGNLAYVACSYSGIQIIDINDNTNSSLVSSFQGYSKAQDIDISGDFVYLADRYAGLDVIDISDISDPIITGTYFDGIGRSDNVSINNNNLCFSRAYPYHELLFVDISVPDNPILLHQVDLSEVLSSGSIALFQTISHVFVGAGDTLQIYNISDFSNPVLIAKYATTAKITDIIVLGDQCFISIGEDGIEIINIESINSPQHVGSYNTSGYAEQLVYQSGILIIADGESGFQILNISNPTLPFLMESIKPYYYSNIIVKPLIVGNRMIIVDSEWNEIFTYDVTNFSTIQLLSSFKLNADISRIIYHSELFFCSIKYYGMIILEKFPILSIIDDEIISKTGDDLYIYPNPFISSITINYTLEERSFVNIEIYNQSGMRIKFFNEQFRNKGMYQIEWDGTDGNNCKVKKGIYIIKIRKGNKTDFRKVLSMG